MDATHELDPRLEADTHAVSTLDLCALRLMDDARWPWLILVPRRAAVEEVHDLSREDRARLVEEQSRVAAALQRLTGCRSINVAALGNVVAQLHVHVVARDPGDPNWPGPVWGHGARVPYAERAASELIGRVREAVAGGAARA